MNLLILYLMFKFVFQCNMLSLISNERRVQVRWGDLKTDFSDEFQLRYLLLFINNLTVFISSSL